jgi:Rrf2 family protein
MKLSKKGEYAVKALQYLSLNYQRDIIQMGEISEKQKIPLKFLEQILLTLKKAGILQSKMGLKGGYRLARRPDKISLGEVLRIIEGPLDPVDCIRSTSRKECQEEDECSLRIIMLEVKDAISQVLDRVTLQEICDRANELKEQYSIVLDYQI